MHTLEAAKALLAAQAAAAPAQIDEADDEEELFEYEAEIETDETEGLVDDRAAGEEAGAAEGEGDGQRRKRRRRRRGRGGANEARDGVQPPREDGDLMHVLPDGTEVVAAGRSRRR
ncbi:hypothetical protein ACVWW1_002522 [Bradyrhizobium sp. JR3.5]